MIGINNAIVKAHFVLCGDGVVWVFSSYLSLFILVGFWFGLFLGSVRMGTAVFLLLNYVGWDGIGWVNTCYVI